MDLTPQRTVKVDPRHGGRITLIMRWERLSAMMKSGSTIGRKIQAQSRLLSASTILDWPTLPIVMASIICRGTWSSGPNRSAAPSADSARMRTMTETVRRQKACASLEAVPGTVRALPCFTFPTGTAFSPNSATMTWASGWWPDWSRRLEFSAFRSIQLCAKALHSVAIPSPLCRSARFHAEMGDSSQSYAHKKVRGGANGPSPSSFCDILLAKN